MDTAPHSTDERCSAAPVGASPCPCLTRCCRSARGPNNKPRRCDSTREVALWLWSYGRIDLNGVAIGHHDATHHGREEGNIQQLALIEEAEIKLFADFLDKLKSTDDGGRSLLDETIVFYGSNMGNGSAHSCDNLPIMLAGGFKHAGRVAFDRQNNMPLSNLYARMLQQMGIESDRIGGSAGIVSEV